jgi:hypothetical protein
VRRMTAAPPAELTQLQAVWIVALVLDRRIVASFAVRALQGDDGRATLGRRHDAFASQKRNLAALGQEAVYHSPWRGKPGSSTVTGAAAPPRRSAACAP